MSSENRLTPDQPFIETKVVRDLRMLIERLLLAQARYMPEIALATGDAGIGKTIALAYLCRRYLAQSHTGISAILLLKIKPAQSGRAFLIDVARGVGEHIDRGNSLYVQERFAKRINQQDLKLLIFDEANLMTRSVLEMARNLHDDYGCSLLFVGLSELSKSFAEAKQFQTRRGLELDLYPPTNEEILETILPQLIIPFWIYNQKEHADQALGRKIISKTGGNFRRIVKLLRRSSEIAEAKKLDRIGIAEIDDGYSVMVSGRSQVNDSAVEPDLSADPAEQISENKHNAKRKNR